MTFEEFLLKEKMSKYKLAKLSGVPYSTLSDICSKKSAIKKCSVETVMKISEVFGMTVEELVAVTDDSVKEELAPAIEKAISLSFSRQAMVEEFIGGREVSVEAISYQGVHYPLQITDKVTTGAPHFVELEHHQPSTLSKEYFSSLYDLTHSALDALGITDGASHSEYKIMDDGSIVIVEIGGRMGGDFIGSDLVRLSTGYDFLKGVIDVALGRFKKPEITKNGHSAVYFLCKETEFLKPVIENLKDNPSFIEGKILDEELRNVECSADRSGYVIFYEK